MKTLSINTTDINEVVDITEIVEEVVETGMVQEGVCSIFTSHTTCAVTTADLDPGTDMDLLESLRKVIPLLSSVIGSSITVPFDKKQLKLGMWQRIVLIELNGPRTRTIRISAVRED